MHLASYLRQVGLEPATPSCWRQVSSQRLLQPPLLSLGDTWPQEILEMSSLICCEHLVTWSTGPDWAPWSPRAHPRTQPSRAPRPCWTWRGSRCRWAGPRRRSPRPPRSTTNCAASQGTRLRPVSSHRQPVVADNICGTSLLLQEAPEKYSLG